MQTWWAGPMELLILPPIIVNMLFSYKSRIQELKQTQNRRTYGLLGEPNEDTGILKSSRDQSKAG